MLTRLSLRDITSIPPLLSSLSLSRSPSFSFCEFYSSSLALFLFHFLMFLLSLALFISFCFCGFYSSSLALFFSSSLHAPVPPLSAISLPSSSSFNVFIPLPWLPFALLPLPLYSICSFSLSYFFSFFFIFQCVYYYSLAYFCSPSNCSF